MTDNAKLFSIYYFSYDNRSEIARIKSFDYDTVQNFLLTQYIKPEHREEIEKTDYGLEWFENTNEDCLLYVALCDKCKHCIDSYSINQACELGLSCGIETCSRFTLDKSYNACDYCESLCLRGFSIEEFTEPTENDYSFKTIYGTNEYFDLTQEPYTKSENWSKLIAKQETSQKKISALIPLR